jgi:outer membrane biosynthesis protein TonB
MIRIARAAFIVALVALPLAACDTFDPTDLFDGLSRKTPLPGERKAVFPEGTPGVPQGVPPELVKGAQPVDAMPAPQDAAAAAVEPEPEPKPKAKPKAKPKPKVAAAPEQSRPARVTVRPSNSEQPSEQVQWPDPPQTGAR